MTMLCLYRMLRQFTTSVSWLAALFLVNFRICKLNNAFIFFKDPAV